MMLSGWLRPQRVLVAVVAVAGVVFACSDTTKSRGASSAGVTDPSFTMGVGFTSTLIGRGNLGPFHLKSRVNGYDVDLKSSDNTDIAVANISVAPGGSSGWHYHPGPVFVVVKTGTITFYRAGRSQEDGEHEGANNSACTATRYSAGTTFTENGGVVGNARNEGAVEVTSVATYFVPAGSPTRIDAPVPGGCAP